jgi:hypothetical protein
MNLLQHIIHYELEEQKYIKLDDHESNQVISKLLAEFNSIVSKQDK